MMGAIMSVPTPDQQDAILLAKALLLLKYVETITMAVKFMRPKPTPRDIILWLNT